MMLRFLRRTAFATAPSLLIAGLMALGLALPEARAA